ncbi:MAG: hypothetical protein ACREFY_20260 [Acetobacteraceae bacterium]
MRHLFQPPVHPGKVGRGVPDRVGRRMRRGVMEDNPVHRGVDPAMSPRSRSGPVRVQAGVLGRLVSRRRSDDGRSERSCDENKAATDQQ